MYAGEGPQHMIFRGCWWKRPRLPLLRRRSIGKETTAGSFPPAVFFFAEKLGAKSCLSPTNSAAPSPICGSQSRIVATTSVFIAEPATRARYTESCRLKIISALRAFWFRSGSLKFVSPVASRYCAEESLISSGIFQSSDLRG